MALKLRDSQRVALKRLCEPGRKFAALWAEPRSGKTAVSLRWLEHTKTRVAVIVGPKVAEATWRNEATKWLRVPYRFFPLTAGNEYPELSRIKHDGITLLFVNYDQFGKAPFKRLKPFLMQVSKMIDGKGAMLLDESHVIKTPSGIIGRNIRPLAQHWQYRLLITGTPVTNPTQIDAVYGQWTFLDPSIRDHWATARDFREHFGEWSTVKGFPELIRPIRQYELNAYIQGNVITMTGAVDPVPIRKATYTVPDNVLAGQNLMLKHGIVKYDRGKLFKYDEDLPGRDITGLNPLTRLLRMRTLVAGWAKDDEGKSFTVREAARARLSALGKVLKRTDGKVIIACTHLHEVALVAKYLRSKGIGYHTITGKTKEKNLVIERFQYGQEKVLLVQPRTVSMAVDISVANDLIWYTSDFSYVTFKQASDRIKLSPSNPTVWFLCGKGSVDEDVWVTLQKDHKHLSKVIGRIKKSISASGY